MQHFSKQNKIFVRAGLFAALTCVATMVIHIPTPTFGYIHPGDSLVLLSGIFLNPLAAFLSAGIGSMLSDLFSGYAIYMIPTFLIKGLCAMSAGILYRSFMHRTTLKTTLAFALSGIVAEAIMIIGYFITDFFKAFLFSGPATKQALSLAYTNGFASIAPNLVQASAGIILGALLLPFLLKVPELSNESLLSSNATKMSHSTRKGEHRV